MGILTINKTAKNPPREKRDVTEIKIQGDIIKYLNKIGAFVVRVKLSNGSGVPDIIGCYQSVFFGIEVKKVGNKPTELQKIKIDLINKAGGFAGICHNLTETEEFMEKVKLQALLINQRKQIIERDTITAIQVANRRA